MPSEIGGAYSEPAYRTKCGFRMYYSIGYGFRVATSKVPNVNTKKEVNQ